jgi:glycosyltransferase involved in cell wall biosynthesis
MMISVVCPVYNEEKYIEKLLLFYKNAKPADKEIFLIDGGSTDRTKEIIIQYATNDTSIRLLDNPNKFVPFALNTAIPWCRGEYIVRLDAHTLYAKDYFEKILLVFKESGADIVGGPMRAVGNSDFQKAVAFATSTPFGVGNSQFHFEDYKGFTDSVYLGAWKKEIFKTTGLFDEQMIRNQDDEFHYRAKSAGFKIYQDPAIVSHYYPRDSLKKLARQYFEYGLYKPLVLKKIKSEVKLRHLIPLAFVLYVLSLPAGLVFTQFYIIPLLVYGILLIGFSMINKLTWISKINCLVIYPALHIAYGLGFLWGLLKK